jgi:type IV secretion system protein VirB10
MSRRNSGDETTVGRQTPAAAQGTVRGERGLPAVDQARSLQSRASSVMAFGLMIILGAGLLTWYYTNAYSRQSQAAHAAKAASANRAQGEMPLPALEQIDAQGTESSRPVLPPSSASAAQSAQPALAQAPMQSVYGPGEAPYALPQPKSEADLERERLLSGAAFARASDPTQSDSSTSGPVPGMPASGLISNQSGGDIAPLLRRSVITSTTASVLPTQQFLLPKGAFIDCTLETAIDSTLPGMTTCITATDTFGVDGHVILLERGTKLIGETRGQVQRGAARVFVLWTEARTPKGIIVPLDSPGTDELGRAGLAGQVDRHFWERFGAAILISTLDGAVQAAVQAQNRGGGAVVYPSTSENVVTDVLKSTVDIPPTINKKNGDRIQIFVARDVDFRTVYELRTASTH